MMKKPTVFFAFFLSLFALYSQAQIKHVKRVEIVLGKENYLNYTLVPMGKNGILLFRKGKPIPKSRGHYWELLQYDCDLKKIWETSIPLDRNAYYINHYYDSSGASPKVIFFLSKFKEKRNELFIIDILQRKIDKKIFEAPKFYTLTRLEAHDKSICLIGENFGSLLIGSYDLRKETFTNVPIKLRGRLLSTNMRSQQDLVDVISLMPSNRTQNRSLTIKTFSNYSNPEPKSNFSIELDSDILRVYDPKILFSNNERIVTGTYTVNSLYPKGIFISKITDTVTSFTKYYRFSDFNSVVTHFNKQKNAEDKKRVQKKNEIIKPDTTKSDKSIIDKLFNLYTLHELIQIEDQYILVAENCYPIIEFRPDQRVGFGEPLSSLSTKSSPSITRYGTYNALIAGFDKNGNLLWDECLDMRNSDKKYQMDKIISLHSVKDNIKLFYRNWDELYANTVQFSTTPVLSATAKSDLNGDQGKNTFENSVSHWYDNFFIVWGGQHIEDPKSKKFDPDRNIFYFEKIQY